MLHRRVRAVFCMAEAQRSHWSLRCSYLGKLHTARDLACENFILNKEKNEVSLRPCRWSFKWIDGTREQQLMKVDSGSEREKKVLEWYNEIFATVTVACDET
jgi:hypothetical protein